MRFAKIFYSLPTLVVCGFLFPLQTSISSNVHSDETGSQSTETLSSAAEPMFRIGVGLSSDSAQTADEKKLLGSEFSVITPENCMKPAAIQPTAGNFDFAQADEFMKLASDNHLAAVGHCLIWAKDDRTPAWFFADGKQTASKALLLARMKTHIDTVVGRYADQIDQWDVVNEVIDDAEPLWRPSGWQSACGPDFIVKAFEYAHAADPTAMLIYNDYRTELPGKRDKLFKLIRYLQENDTPVHAIGLQGHYELDDVPFDDLEITLNEIRKLGLKVVISELDIDVVKRGKWYAENGKFRDELATYDPYSSGCPAEILQRQAEQYARLFEVYTKHSDIIERVTFWNLHDGQSWLNYFPWNRTNHPLLFDRMARPKPAYHAAIETLLRKKRENDPRPSKADSPWVPSALPGQLLKKK